MPNVNGGRDSGAKAYQFWWVSLFGWRPFPRPGLTFFGASHAAAVKDAASLTRLIQRSYTDAAL